MADIILYDTETTGLLEPEINDLNKQPSIIELYAVRLDKDFNIVGEFNHMISPPAMISPTITRITGITNDQLQDKPSFPEVLPELKELFLGVKRMVCHNLPFDRSMLANELLRVDEVLKFPWPPEHICTVESSMPIYGHRMSLTKLHEWATGGPIFGGHRAKTDVFAMVVCYHALLERGYIPEI